MLPYFIELLDSQIIYSRPCQMYFPIIRIIWIQPSKE